MLAIVLATPCIIMGSLSIVGTVVRARRGDVTLSNSNEMNAVLWFILAALVLK